jgi:hypothetical protein
MKSEHEIQNKIDELEDQISKLRQSTTTPKQMRQTKYGHAPHWLDALQWVLEKDDELGGLRDE